MQGLIAEEDGMNTPPHYSSVASEKMLLRGSPHGLLPWPGTPHYRVSSEGILCINQTLFLPFLETLVVFLSV